VIGYRLENWGPIPGQYGGFTFATAFGSDQRLTKLLINVYGGKEFGNRKQPLTSK
jgi:hypothetical protein